MTAARFLLAGVMVFAGCRTVHDVAVTSFHVIDAPAKFVRDRLDQDQTTTTTTTTTTASDVTTPGAPVTAPAAPPKVVHHQAATHRSSVSSQQKSRPRSEETSSTSQKVSASPTTVARPSPAATTQFPTAKPVPGKPGYVYSIDPKGGIIDVTGYKSGDKAKDPYTKQIFIVP